MIYQKPVSQEDPEGKARLEKFVCKDDHAPYLETWEVIFHNDKAGQLVMRKLIPDIRIEEGKEDKYTRSDLIGREHATFTIIAVRESTVPGKQIALGYRRLTGQFQGVTVEYVVWIHNNTTDCFFYGKYYGDFFEAVEEFRTRV